MAPGQRTRKIIERPARPRDVGREAHDAAGDEVEDGRYHEDDHDRGDGAR